MERINYLALGDSYTIGEQVRLHENFPYQTVHLLRKMGFWVQAPEIIAVTGFTTDELVGLMNEQLLTPPYQLVSLLIGVNNQYRGRSVENFSTEFMALLNRAIQLADGVPGRVWVLSIPDWGLTPFAKERDSQKIALEIDAYNQVCREMAVERGVGFIDITTTQRRDGHLREYLASDELHPSGLEYAKWAALLAHEMAKYLQKMAD